MKTTAVRPWISPPLILGGTSPLLINLSNLSLHNAFLSHLNSQELESFLLPHFGVTDGLFRCSVALAMGTLWRCSSGL